MTPDERRLRRVAQRIVDKLFTFGLGEIRGKRLADRLVLSVSDGDRSTDMGGWCIDAVRSQIVDILTEEEAKFSPRRSK